MPQFKATKLCLSNMIFSVTHKWKAKRAPGASTDNDADLQMRMP